MSRESSRVKGSHKKTGIKTMWQEQFRKLSWSIRVKNKILISLTTMSTPHWIQEAR